MEECPTQLDRPSVIAIHPLYKAQLSILDFMVYFN
jgi:hypothetical protein